MEQRDARDLRRRAGWGAAAVAATLALGGCGKPAGVIFDPAAQGPSWPPPPDAPRVFYLGQIRTSGDLKAARSFGQGLNDALFGKEPQHGFVSPMAVCTDGGDRVFVADSNAQMVHVLDLKTRKYAQWKPPAGQGEMAQPVALAFDSARGRLLVADAAGGVIVVFDSAGKFLGSLGEGVLKRPCGMALDGSGRILVADPGAHQVLVLSGEGDLLKRVGARGSGPGEFNFPTNVAVDGAGNLYVSDSLNFRVQVLGPDFAFVREIGSKGDMPGYFSQPKGLALDRWGHLYVVDANFEAVQLFATTGEPLMTFGHEGAGPGEFWLPAGIFVEPSGRIWVADSYNKRVQAFEYREPAGGPDEGGAPDQQQEKRP